MPHRQLWVIATAMKRGASHRQPGPQHETSEWCQSMGLASHSCMVNPLSQDVQNILRLGLGLFPVQDKQLLCRLALCRGRPGQEQHRGRVSAAINHPPPLTSSNVSSDAAGCRSPAPGMHRADRDAQGSNKHGAGREAAAADPQQGL